MAADKKNKGSRNSGGGVWQGRKRRDDTPSFIRNVQARADLLNPPKDVRHSIPVLAMPSSVRIWQKVRWPLFVSIVLIILVSVGLFTNDFLVARSVERRIEEAGISEEGSRIEVMLETNRVLAEMADSYPGRSNTQAAYAWNAVLLSQLFGNPEAYLEPAKNSIDAIATDTSALGYAARAGKYCALGNFDSAGKVLAEAMPVHGNEPRIHLVDAWVKIGNGETAKALENLRAMRKKFPKYLPTLFMILSLALEEGDRREILRASTEFRTESTGNLFAVLTSIFVMLPEWNGAPLLEDELRSIAKDAAMLAKRTEKAPAKFKQLGQFVQARVDLLTGKHEKAARSFKKLADNGNQLNALAWYGKAIRMMKGPVAALKAVEYAGDNPSFEIYDLRARCYLDEYQVVKAEEALKELEGKKGFDVKELNWILAVRKGDAANAKKLMPQSIDSRLRLLAIEMYELLLKRGDKDGILDLVGRMVDDMQHCAEGIQNWHSRRTKRVTIVFQKEDPCYTALGLRLMRGHYPPATMKEMAQRAVAFSEGDLRVEVDRALAIWNSDGRDAAMEILAQVQKSKPQGAPLLAALGQAYLMLGLPGDAEIVLQGNDHPEVVSLLMQALVDQGKTGQQAKLLTESMGMEERNTHPAIVIWDLNRRLEANDLSGVVERVDGIMEGAGGAGLWTAEIAEAKAKALNAMGSRGDADRYLSSTARNAVSSLGLGESRDVSKALIRLNLRRGGAFLFKAVGVTLELYKSDIKDAEVTYSYGVEFMRQGNEKGSIRYFQEAITLDPSFVPPYGQLKALGRLTPEAEALLQTIRPGTEIK